MARRAAPFVSTFRRRGFGGVASDWTRLGGNRRDTHTGKDATNSISAIRSRQPFSVESTKRSFFGRIRNRKPYDGIKGPGARITYEFGSKGKFPEQACAEANHWYSDHITSSDKPTQCRRQYVAEIAAATSRLTGAPGKATHCQPQHVV